MTSEAPHRPGQEPGEVSSGAGGPAPYGDRPAQQDNGHPGAADLGWAPPPPAGSPAQPAPAWATPDDQRPAWAEQGGQPAAARASVQVPPAGEPGPWAASPQPAWGAPEQAGPAWGAPEQGTPAWAAAPPAASGEQSPPAWAAAPPNASPEPAQPAWSTPAEQAGSAWGAAPAPAAAQGEQPAWAQPGEPSARGAAQVPAPHEPWAANAGQQDAANTGGWNPSNGPQSDDPARSGGWPAASGPQEDHSGGWAAGAGAQQQDDPNRSGGWGGPPQDDPPAWGQPAEAAAPAWASAEPTARAAAKVSVPGAPADGGWPAAQDEPDRSGGWATGQPEAAQPWGAPDEQRPAWDAAQQHDQGRPADEPAQAGRASARASVSVPAADAPSARPGNQDNPAQWTPERPAIPDAEPWAPGEAWGRSAEPGPDEPPSNGWEPARAEESPIYQPAPGPGISPANAVPLPQQEQRVPGAALAASPPTDYAPPAQFEPAAQGYEPEQAGWGTPEPAREEPQSPAGPVVPGPRTAPDSGAAGAVSASASVPMSSRVTPPTDQPLHPAGVPAPQPRVYGRPTRPEPEEPPGQDAPNGFSESGPRFDEPGPQARFDEPDHPAGPNAYAEAPAVPSSPAGPPPFPPGVPNFVDPAGNNRPVNGVHPQNDARPDPFGGPAGQPNPFGGPGGQPDPFGGPGGQPDPFGGPGGQPDPFGGPGGQPDPFGGPGGQPDPFGGPGGQPDPFGGPGNQPNPFGGPGGQPNPFGGPGNQPNPFGGPGGQPNPFGGPGGQADPFGAAGGGRASVGVPGPGAMGEAGQGGFPPPAQPAPPEWSQGQANGPDQGRFDAFKPEAEPQAEAPTPKVRNGRVLIAVLVAAVLILAIPLGLLTLLGKIGGDDNEPAPFNPAVGSCVKQSGNSAAKADCAEPGAFKVVSKAEGKDKCADPAQPSVELQGVEGNRWLCLKPADK
ncbi:LppU/SCO3897 family protein [Micromonospora eburnea]|uniref:Uncharacterized protein n=1 Tax=Micromonospora eburnea TaxID=227316 RepID=A0A1C6TQ17_9ACTN|nr:hypothetical protein [Micromonospora eburnea]SCL43905.1 hypothetical protein GA0070604_0064 [Micromonospora eburnea]